MGVRPGPRKTPPGHPPTGGSAGGVFWGVRRGPVSDPQTGGRTGGYFWGPGNRVPGPDPGIPGSRIPGRSGDRVWYQKLRRQLLAVATGIPKLNFGSRTRCRQLHGADTSTSEVTSRVCPSDITSDVTTKNSHLTARGKNFSDIKKIFVSYPVRKKNLATDTALIIFSILCR